MATSGLNTLLGSVVGPGLSISPLKRRKELSDARSNILASTLTVSDATRVGNNEYTELVKQNQAAPKVEATPTPAAETVTGPDELGYDMASLFKSISRPVHLDSETPTGNRNVGLMYSDKEFEDYIRDNYYPDGTPFAPLFRNIPNDPRSLTIGQSYIDREVTKAKAKVKSTIADKSWKTSEWYTQAKSWADKRK